jgi:flagellar hook-associated protein 3 FlgL
MVSVTSTNTLMNVMRRSILDMQARLTKTQSEATTGRVADLGLALGGATARDLSLGLRGSELAAIGQSNAAVSIRLEATASTLDSIATTAQNFLDAIASASSAVGADAAAIRGSATAALKSLVSDLDTSVGGVYIFGGVNSGAPPIADYFADPPSAAKQALDQAFSSEFGVSQSSADVGAIGSDQMKTFLSGSFADLFSSGGWSEWSNASDAVMRARITLSQSIDASVSANDPALQKLAMAYTMVADLGVESLSGPAYQELLQQATSTMSEAISELTKLRASVGLMQQNVADANQTISIQRDAITTQIGALENVDPYEASTRLTSLMTQIETAYTITGKIQQLTLSKYI